MQLNASTRELLGKRTRRLHRQGKLAAVVYGHNTKPTALVLDRLEFQKVFLKSGRTHLVDLLVDSARSEKVLVREIQTHPRRLGPIHVDFYAVSLEEKITVEVPVHLTGESAAEGETPAAEEAAEKKKGRCRRWRPSPGLRPTQPRCCTSWSAPSSSS